MQFQIVVRLVTKSELPPSPPMDKTAAESDIAAIRKASVDGSELDLAWLTVDSRLIESASLTPAAPSRKLQSLG